FFAHDRTRLNEVQPEEIEAPASSEQGGTEAINQAELESSIDPYSSTQLSPASQLERLEEFFAHDRTRLNEVQPEEIQAPASSQQGGTEAINQAELESSIDP